MQAIRELVGSVLLNIQKSKGLARGRLTDCWSEIVGPRLTSHTKPSLNPQGKLCVWVDQSSLAHEINQRHRPSILKRAQALLGEEAVTQVYVRVGELR